MSAHSIGMFLHIAGALGISAALALEWTGLWQIRSTIIPEQVRAWLGIFKGATRLGIISMLITVLTGIFEMVVEWGLQAWLIVSLVSIVLMIVFALGLTRPRMAAIGQALAVEKRPGSPTIHLLASHPLLWISIQTRITILLGILFLMFAKAGWSRSLIILGVAIILGIASVLPMPRRERTQEGPAD